MKLLWHETVIQLKLTYRDRQAIFFGYAFPILLLILFLSVSGGSNNPRAGAGTLAGVITISIMLGTLFGIGVEVARAREEGILRRYRVAPVPKLVLIFSVILSRFLVLLLTMINLILVATLIYHSEFHADPLVLFFIFSFGLLTFASIGYFLASIVKTTQAAIGIGNIFFVPMMLMSGATIPFYFLPLWMQTIARFLPATPLMDVLEDAIVFGRSFQDIWLNLLMLFGFGLVATFLSLRFFRWE